MPSQETGQVRTSAAYHPPTDYQNQPFIPVEFSVAACGHGMVRGDYELNDTAQNIPIFDMTQPDGDLRDFKERRAELAA